VCAWNLPKLKRLVGYKFETKTSHEKAAPLTTLLGLICARNKTCSNYSINQCSDGFIFFQAMNIVLMFAIFNLWLVCTWKLAVLKWLVGYKFERKTSCEKSAPLRTLVGLIFERNKNRSRYRINQGIDGLKTFQAMNHAPLFF